MARRPRNAPGGLAYHVLNRSVGKMEMFRRDADFEAFQRIMREAIERHPIRIICYCVMPTHWHFVVWPEEDGQVTRFFRWLAHTHAMRWRVSHHTVGYGHLYQGRFKSFPVARDEHLLTLCRYVERNPLSANLVKRAEDWRWSSLWLRSQNADTSAGASAGQKAILSDWPLDRPKDWIERVNRAVTAKELEAIETSLKRGRPLGSGDWAQKIAARLDLEHTIRREGRPKKMDSSKNAADKN
ncbi:MAG: transposase [Tepidisphaeraceae bacterium]|jgi:putative transposase